MGALPAQIALGGAARGGARGAGHRGHVGRRQSQGLLVQRQAKRGRDQNQQREIRKHGNK